MSVKCSWDSVYYIDNIDKFGFLYTIDDINNRFSNGTNTCLKIEDPFTDAEMDDERPIRSNYYK